MQISNSTNPASHEEEKSLSYEEILSQIKFLQGKVLTVIEASIANEPQQKAVKDLIKKMFSEQLTWILKQCYPSLPVYPRDQVESLGLNIDSLGNELN